MNNPFEKIIGYDAIRKELERTADALRDPTPYARLGACAPRGLLLCGEPGVGKTLMASCLVEASGRKCFLCRKDKPDGVFVDEIRGVFEQAKNEAPSIVFLDDLDKFANNDEDHTDSEEYVTVQSCIDASRGAEVFILATANSMSALPESLTRTGRFDRVLHVLLPESRDAEAIVRHYLSQKNFVATVDPAVVTGILGGCSCADLETAINKAGLLAGYERAEKITERHLLLGCLDVGSDVSPDSIIRVFDGKDATLPAYHEAGHAAVSELLFPGSVTAVCLFERFGRIEGFTTYRDDDNEPQTLDARLGSAVRMLAGRAANLHRSGVCDVGSARDVEKASRCLDELASSAVFGFDLADGAFETSQTRLAHREQFLAKKLEECADRALRLLAENTPFFEALARELLEKGLLISDDVRRIRESLRG